MELKFKAYIKPLNEIKELYGFNKDHVFLDSLDTPQIGETVFRRVDCVILQSTGFFDIDDNEIYIGDIILEGTAKILIDKDSYFTLARIKHVFGKVIGNINIKK